MESTLHSPELLSPAGSLETFFAALEAGADAVYCGLKDFSARARARNFTLRDLERMTTYAHRAERKVFVTLNTLIKESELPALAETLDALEAMGIDAVILQDLAVWRLARRHFPALELHASTQMTIHNSAGVRMLENMGFSRGILARELTLEEIATIRRNTTLELEHFVHGALCFSFSGQCYFSSWMGGQSGNRGRCAQPCRRRFRYGREEGYYFSTSDLSAIDLLPELRRAGVRSFKIEGRMKSAEYVFSVVSAYRKVIDAPEARRRENIRNAKELLKGSFGRPPTRGFLTGADPSDIAVPSLKGATGRFLGEISSIRGAAFTFTSKDRLHVGDRVRIQPRSDQAGIAFTVREIRMGTRTVKLSPAGAAVTLSSPREESFRVGDSVFKVSSEQAFTLSEAAGRKRLEATAAEPDPVRLHLEMTGDRLIVSGRAGSVSLIQEYPVENFPAVERPLSASTLEGVFRKSGVDHFHLVGLETGNLPPVVIPPSRLKEIRRDFYRRLRTSVTETRRTARGKGLKGAISELLRPRTDAPPPGRQITVAVRDLRDMHILNDPLVDDLLIPLSPATLRGSERLTRSARYIEGITWDLPFIIFDDRWDFFEAAVKDLVARGFKRFRLNNPGQFLLFEGLEDLRLTAGFRLYSLNSQATLAWRELGAGEFTGHIEDDRNNLKDLLSRNVGIPAALVVYDRVPLMTSRIRIRGARSDRPLVSGRGEQFFVDDRSGLTVITPEQDFSLLGELRDLQSLGCGRFLIDLREPGPFSPAGKTVMAALRQEADVPGASSFNYRGGME